MNSTDLVGYVSTDIKISYTEGTNIPFTRFQLACKDGHAKADFLQVIAWRKTALAIVKFVKKGDQLGVSGSNKSERYEDKEGIMRFVQEVKARTVTFIGEKQVVVLPEDREEDVIIEDYDVDDAIKF